MQQGREYVFPDFNHSGVIPPFVTDPAQRDGAPYETTMVMIAQKLATTPERRVLLTGLLNYRAALRAVGITAGFQLIDGSFTEACEQFRGRPPGDIDVVTFAHFPAATQAQILQFIEDHGALIDSEQVKETFRCDGFIVNLGNNAQLIVEDTFYWYGLFSHQRNTYTWKGTLRVPLMADDEAAREVLAEQANAGDIEPAAEQPAAGEAVLQGAGDGT
jgi:hypothetical protein